MQHSRESQESMKEATEKALQFATEKHGGQKRRGGEDYVQHCIRVSMTVSWVTSKEEVIIAALLHDTLEDTQTSYDELETQFGPEVARLVRSLSNDEAEMALMGGKREYLAKKINTLDADALLIKLADRIDNISDLGTNDWSRKYCEQTRHVFLESLRTENLLPCHLNLLATIRESVEECERKLSQ